jgi:hypothetical protein
MFFARMAVFTARGFSGWPLAFLCGIIKQRGFEHNGKRPSEQQRELILQILFRPSATGIVKDDASPPIIAKWLNMITS